MTTTEKQQLFTNFANLIKGATQGLRYQRATATLAACLFGAVCLGAVLMFADILFATISGYDTGLANLILNALSPMTAALFLSIASFLSVRLWYRGTWAITLCIVDTLKSNNLQPAVSLLMQHLGFEKDCHGYHLQHRLSSWLAEEDLRTASYRTLAWLEKQGLTLEWAECTPIADLKSSPHNPNLDFVATGAKYIILNLHLR